MDLCRHIKVNSYVHVETIDGSMGLTLICRHRSKEFKDHIFSININDFTNLEVKSTRWNHDSKVLGS